MAEHVPGLSLWPASTCLITELAHELAALTPKELRATAVVLPTKRLSVWLLAKLAHTRRAFVPPWTANLDEFVARLSPEAEDASPLSELEQELLLAAILKAGQYRHLRFGHEHEVKQLLDELVAWDLDDDGFTRLETVLAEDIFRSEQALGSLHERVLELRDVSERYLEALARRGATTPKRFARARSRRLATLLLEGLQLQAPRTLERIYLVGFTSIERMHGAMLRALVARSDARVWIPESPPLHTEVSPVRLLLSLLGVPGTHRTPRSARPAPRPVTVHSTSGVLTEVAHALNLARQATEDGIPPSGVALLVTDDKTYGRALRALLPGAGFEANVALALPLATTSAGTWIAAVLDLLQGDDDVARILALATHPLTLTRSQDVTRAMLAWELLASGVPSGLAEMAASPKVSPPVRALLLDLQTLLAPLSNSDPVKARPLTAWARDLGTLLNQGMTRRHADADDVGMDASVETAISAFLQTLGQDADQTLLTKVEFLAFAGPRLLAAEVRGVGEPLAGVQVLSVEEARFVPFDVAIVLGASEGQFPRAVPQDYLLDNYLKTRIGLPGWQLLEAIEDTTFLLLKARVPTLALLYPASRSDEPSVRSRFIEALLANGEATEYRADAEAELLAALTRASGLSTPRKRTVPTAARSHPAGITSKVIPDARQLTTTMSASALENLISCPYRFLLTRLGVNSLEFTKDDDARAEGDWLHDVLEAFFTGHAGDRRVAEPLDPEVPWESFQAYAVRRLEALTLSIAPRHARGSETHLHLKLKAWPAFVAHLMTVYDASTLGQAARGFRELKIEDAPAKVTVAVDGTDVTLRGLIDAIDERPGGHLVTDYKRQRTPERREVLSGLAPQLPLYALALAARDGGRFALQRAVIGYWSILGGRFEGVAAGTDTPLAWSETGLAPAAGTLDAAVEATLALWTWRQQQVTAGERIYAPDPSRCGLCRLSGACRKGDPEIGPAIHRGDLLAQRLMHGKTKNAEAPEEGVGP